MAHRNSCEPRIRFLRYAMFLVQDTFNFRMIYPNSFGYMIYSQSQVLHHHVVRTIYVSIGDVSSGTNEQILGYLLVSTFSSWIQLPNFARLIHLKYTLLIKWWWWQYGCQWSLFCIFLIFIYFQVNLLLPMFEVFFEHSWKAISVLLTSRVGINAFMFSQF